MYMQSPCNGQGDSTPDAEVCMEASLGGENNNAKSLAMFAPLYEAPKKPEPIIAYVPTDLVPPATEHREAFRPSEPAFIHLWFRVRRLNYEQLLWQLMSAGLIRKDRAYDAENLPYWTLGMRVKVRTQLAMGRVMSGILARMGVRCPGIRFCLDGFFGMRGFSDVFNSPDACPWMEVSNFSTVVSLRLKQGDNVFISVASPAQIADVVGWRRKRALTMDTKEPQPAAEGNEDDNGVIGKIAYDSGVMEDLM